MSLTNAIDSGSKVFFQPWCGTAYKKRQRRLLLLGESHHGTNPEPDWTVEVVKRYIANEVTEPWFRTFTAIRHVVTGRTFWEVDRSDFWNSAAFYNYVQEPVLEARCRPTSQMFAAGREAFVEILSSLQPTHVLALGIQLWRHMPQLDERRATLECAGVDSDCGIYRSQDGQHGAALVIRIPHPVSWGFSPKKWHPLVAKFLALHV